jgi:hypothetical protein
MDRFQQYIDGAFEDGAEGFDSLDPATGAPWARMPMAGAADVDRAVQAAHRAFVSGPWPAMTASVRGKLLFRLAQLVREANAPRLAALETRDTGKIIRETSAQIAYVAEYYQLLCRARRQDRRRDLPIDKPDMEVWLRREPVGVVAAIVPWNSSSFSRRRQDRPGARRRLHTGGEGLARTARRRSLNSLELVHEAGFPPGVVNVMTGFGPDLRQRADQPPQGRPHRLYRRAVETARHIVRARPRTSPAPRWNWAASRPSSSSPTPIWTARPMRRSPGIFAATGQSCVAGSRLLVRAQRQGGIAGPAEGQGRSHRDRRPSTGWRPRSAPSAPAASAT